MRSYLKNERLSLTLNTTISLPRRCMSDISLDKYFNSNTGLALFSYRYFLASTTYFLYGESLIYYFKEIIVVDAFLRPLAYHHRLISFALYCIGEF